MDTRAREYLTQLLAGSALAQPISVAARLGLADLLAEGARTAGELAADTRTHAGALDRLLRVLATMGVLSALDGRYALTPVGALLRSAEPGSLRPVAVLAGAGWRAAWVDLLECVRTGEPAFARRFGASMYGYLEAHPDEAAAFHAVQEAHAAAIDLAAAVDATGASVVVDVGGGTGATLARLLAARPVLRGVLCDLPSAITGSGRVLAAAGVADRCTAVAGDFLEGVPGGGDLYLLAFVLHNWDDPRAARILERCAAAMRPGARLFIVENVLTPERPLPLSSLLDLEMLVFTEGGRERTEAEYCSLAEACGFSLLAARATGSTASAVDLVRA